MREHFWRWGLALLVLAACLRLPSLSLPLDRDEGEYATLAQQWLQGGGLPYRDFLEQKPPLAVAVDALAIKTLGESVLSLRIVALLWQLATLFALLAFMRRFESPGAALVATTLYALASCGARVQGLGANAESFIALPLLLGLLAVMHEPEGGEAAWGWLLFGLCGGLAGLAKQSALPAVVALTGAVAYVRRPTLKAWGLVILGFAGIWALVLGLFSLAGSARALVHCVFLYNIGYAGQGLGGFFSRLAGCLIRLAPEQLALWGAAMVALLKPAYARGRRGVILAAWLVGAAAGVALSGRFYPHYFQVMLAPLCCLAGTWLASWDWESAGDLRLRAALAALFLAGWLHSSAALYLAPDGGARSREIFGLRSFADAPIAADLIKHLDAPAGPLFIWGSEAELYFLTNRPPSSRFLFNYPLTGEAPAWPGGEEEMLEGLRKASVAVMPVDARLDPNVPFQARLAAVLSRDFDAKGRTEQFLVGVRKPATDAYARR